MKIQDKIEAKGTGFKQKITIHRLSRLKSSLQIALQKYIFLKKFFFSKNIYKYFSKLITEVPVTLDQDPDLDPNPNWATILDPDPNSMQFDPQHWTMAIGYRWYNTVWLSQSDFQVRDPKPNGSIKFVMYF